jgi:hypothetical protein
MGFFFSSERGDYSFCWYWWNWSSIPPISTNDHHCLNILFIIIAIKKEVLVICRGMGTNGQLFVFWLANLHPSWKKIGCISIPSKSVQVFWFKFLVWYTRSKNLNGDLDAKLASCILGLTLMMWNGRRLKI